MEGDTLIVPQSSASKWGTVRRYGAAASNTMASG